MNSRVPNIQLALCKNVSVEWMTPERFMASLGMKRLTIDQLEEVLGLVNRSLIDEYASAMKMGCKFPALLLDKTEEWLGCTDSGIWKHDGRHRALAAQEIGLERVPVQVRE